MHAKFMCTSLRGVCDLQCQRNVTVQTNRKRQHKAPAQAGRAPWRSAFRQGRRDGGCPGEGRENALSPAAGGATAVPLPDPGAPPGRARPSAPVVPPSGPARPEGGREAGREHGAACGPAAGEPGAGTVGRAGCQAREGRELPGVGHFRCFQRISGCFLISRSAFFHFRILENALLN